MKIQHLFILICLIVIGNCLADEKTNLRLGVQAGGTLEWELTALAAANSNDFQLEIHTVANSDAGKAALQSGEVDMIVSDWIWVSNRREQGDDFTFYPYSDTAGALVVPENSSIKTIKDLKGKRLGIAGGELDKNWLLLQALAKKEAIDLNKSVQKTFGAPSLINEKIRENHIDAALTYWHFATRLEAAGFRQIIDDRGILKNLGIEENVPNLGYVFKQSWGIAHQSTLTAFFKAAQQARKVICMDETAWRNVIPLTKTNDPVTQKMLRQGFCEGNIDTQWGKKEQQAAARIYTLVKTLQPLSGISETLQAGIFWQGLVK